MDWISLISNIGFPIVACICMALWVRDILEKSREDTKELNEQHTKEMAEFKDEIKVVLNNNTLALTKLCEKLDRREEVKIL